MIHHRTQHQQACRHTWRFLTEGLTDLQLIRKFDHLRWGGGWSQNRGHDHVLYIYICIYLIIFVDRMWSNRREQS